MSLPQRVRLVEVGPRDGLQNEARPIDVADKIRLVGEDGKALFLVDKDLMQLASEGGETVMNAQMA